MLNMQTRKREGKQRERESLARERKAHQPRGSRGRVTRPGISPRTTRPLEREKRKRDTDTHEEDPARTLKEEGHKTQDVVCHTDETNFFFFFFWRSSFNVGDSVGDSRRSD